MNTIIIYATNSGSTFLTARQISNTLQKKHRVVMKKAAEVYPHELHLYPLILIGSPSWDADGKEGQPHNTITELLHRLEKIDLSHSRFGVFGCGDSAYTYFCGAVDVISSWIHTHHGDEIIEPLKIDGYYFDRKQNEEQIESWSKKLIAKL